MLTVWYISQHSNLHMRPLWSGRSFFWKLKLTIFSYREMCIKCKMIASSLLHMKILIFLQLKRHYDGTNTLIKTKQETKNWRKTTRQTWKQHCIFLNIPLWHYQSQQHTVDPWTRWELGAITTLTTQLKICIKLLTPPKLNY